MLRLRLQICQQPSARILYATSGWVYLWHWLWVVRSLWTLFGALVSTAKNSNWNKGISYETGTCFFSIKYFVSFHNVFWNLAWLCVFGFLVEFLLKFFELLCITVIFCLMFSISSKSFLFQTNLYFIFILLFGLCQ